MARKKKPPLDELIPCHFECAGINHYLMVWNGEENTVLKEVGHCTHDDGLMRSSLGNPKLGALKAGEYENLPCTVVGQHLLVATDNSGEPIRHTFTETRSRASLDYRAIEGVMKNSSLVMKTSLTTICYAGLVDDASPMGYYFHVKRKFSFLTAKTLRVHWNNGFMNAVVGDVKLFAGSITPHDNGNTPLSFGVLYDD